MSSKNLLPVKPKENHFEVENPSLLVFPETVDVKMTVVQSVKSVEVREIVHTDDFAKVSLVFHDVPLVVEVFVVVRLLGNSWVVSSIRASVSN